MQLSYRLNQIASFVTEGNRLADVGTDHGFIPIELVLRGVIPSAIAMDIGEGPLERAREHVLENDLQNIIECRLSDGVDKLSPEEVDSIVVAGMGGDLMSRILEKADKHFFVNHEWILQPQSEQYKVREMVHRLNCRIEKEDFFIDEGKYYVLMKVVPGQECYDKKEHYIYGKYLLDHKNAVLKTFLEDRQNKLNAIVKQIHLQNENKEVCAEHTLARLDEIKDEQMLIETALAYFL